MKKTFFILVSIISSFSMAKTVNLKLGQTHLEIIELSPNSGDFRPGLFLCEANLNKNKRLIDRNLNMGIWPIVQMTFEGKSFNTNARFLNTVTEQPENLVVSCSN